MSTHSGSKQTIALLHPGDMGAALGACLVANGHRVVWASSGRSPATCARAAAAGLTDKVTLGRALGDADIVFSVCPPQAALDVAEAVAALEFDGLYVDANAIAPDTTREVGALVEAAQARFVDGGIIGPPPVMPGLARLYLSGPQAAAAAALFAGSFTDARVVRGPPGAASALKLAYAAWNKGSIALLAAVRSFALAEGVDAELHAEWAISQPDLPKRSEAVTGHAHKAWRWIAEMEEIATGFKAAGLPPGFHEAAADLYRRLEQFKDAATPPSMKEITASIARWEDA